jgi:predicted amidohydrolase YtcJ
VVANGSDAPIEELDPLLGIRAAVLRTLDERNGWRAQESLTPEQALHATTVAPAWLCGDERRRGKLLPGYLADLVVLDRDPLTCPADELPEVGVVATMVGGRWVHNPPPWNG